MDGKPFWRQQMEVTEMKRNADSAASRLDFEIKRLNASFREALEEPDFQAWLLGLYQKEQREKEAKV